jgi:hypothetical protein
MDRDTQITARIPRHGDLLFEAADRYVAWFEQEIDKARERERVERVERLQLRLKKLEQANQCFVCLDDCFTAVQCCQQTAHRTCLLEWFNRSVTCPACRSLGIVESK